MSLTCVWPAGAILGEGPVWIPEEGALYWVDIKAPAVHRLIPASGEQRSWPMEKMLGCIVPRARGGFVAGFEDGFAFLDLEAGEVTPILNPEPDRPGNRINDGKCDAVGRLWSGSMDNREQDRCGTLYRLDVDLSYRSMDDDYFITNGPAFSPDGRVLYHADSTLRTIYAFDLSPTGELSDKRVFARIADGEGYPDGMTVDEEGHLWVAVYDGARVDRYDETGTVVSSISLPTSNVTSCTFGGPDLRTLYVTTASKGLSPEELRAQPTAGGLFTIEVDVAGLPVSRFAG